MIREMNNITIDLKETGLNLYKMMTEKNYSVRDIQHVCGFDTPQSVYKWLSGKNIPRVDHLIILSMLFEVPMDELIITC